MIVGSVHLYRAQRTGPFGQTKDIEDVARMELSGETPVGVLRSLRVLIDTLEQEMSNQEESKKDKGVERPKPVLRGGRSRLTDADEFEDEDEDETAAGI